MLQAGKCEAVCLLDLFLTAGLWLLAIFLVLAAWADGNPWLAAGAVLAILFAITYTVLAWRLHFRRRRGR